MGQTKSKNTDLFNYEKNLVESLKLYPLLKNNSTEIPVKTSSLNIYVSSTNLCIFLYKGETVWEVNYSVTGTGYSVLGKDGEMKSKEVVEYIFQKTIKFFEESDIEKMEIEKLQYFIKAVELFRKIVWEDYEKTDERKKGYEKMVSSLNEKITKRYALEKEK